MTIYTLKFAEDRYGPAKNVQFEASDPAVALQLAEIESPDRCAELWEGSRKLCKIKRTVENVWQIDT